MDRYSVIGRHTATPATPSTIALLVAGATKRLFVREVILGTETATTATSAAASLGRPTTSGTGGAAYTPLPSDAAAPAAIFTALSATTVWSAEPTQPGTYDRRAAVNVFTTMLYMTESPLVIAVSTRFAARVEADTSGTKQQWTATIVVEE